MFTNRKANNLLEAGHHLRRMNVLQSWGKLWDTGVMYLTTKSPNWVIRRFSCGRDTSYNCEGRQRSRGERKRPSFGRHNSV